MTTGVAPSDRSRSALFGSRVVPATSCPCAVSSGIRARPTTPDPPARKTLIIGYLQKRDGRAADSVTGVSALACLACAWPYSHRGGSATCVPIPCVLLYTDAHAERHHRRPLRRRHDL